MKPFVALSFFFVVAQAADGNVNFSFQFNSGIK